MRWLCSANLVSAELAYAVPRLGDMVFNCEEKDRAGICWNGGV